MLSEPLSANVQPADVLLPHMRRGTELLFQAHQYAQNLKRDAWDFAETIASLQQRGLTNSDLRWLVCIGYVKQGREISKSGDESRKFQCAEGLNFSKKTCFVLTDAGASCIRDFLSRPAHSGTASQVQSDYSAAIDTSDPFKPTWDRYLQELRMGDTIVKRFKVPAPNQEMILAVFHEENWPVCIEDPLPPHPAIDSKRRLHDIIRSLNLNQKNHLMRFMVNRSGEGICWEVISSSDDDTNINENAT